MIKIESLAKSFGTKSVLKGLSVQLSEGNIYGIVGENGAGKTTFFECLCGLKSYTGSIHPHPKHLKSSIGYLPTNPEFLTYTTGREYLHLMAHARGLIIDDLDKKNIFNLPLDQYATRYSTGMKKKLALLGILIQKSNLFILDEPFNGVDIQSNMLIIEIIQKLKESGKTVIISSHIFSTLSRLCDTIMVLENGCISKNVFPEDYSVLEQDMKHLSSTSKLDMLDF